MATFSINEALQVGWLKTKENIWLWVGISITFGVINMAFGWIGNEVGEGLLSWVVSLAGYVVQSLLELGAMAVALKLLDNQPAKFSDVFSQHPLLLQFLIATIVGGVAVVAGLIVFIIPGIYIALRLSQAGFMIVDRKVPGLEALKQSWAVTRGHTLQLLFLSITLAILNVIGALLLFIGLLITIPISTVAMAHVYRKIASAVPMLQPVAPAAVAPAQTLA